MIRVLVVDDSAIVRNILTKKLETDPEIQVVGAAPDAYVAREMIAKEKPDVITLDIEMPKMDGLTFLKKLMTHMPIPVVICSSLSVKGSKKALQAFEYGAVEVLPKPSSAYSLEDMSNEIVLKVKAASKAKVSKLHLAEPVTKRIETPVKTSHHYAAHRIVAIGASTGGTKALRDVLKDMPANGPGIVIVQHMPAGFTNSFASHLNDICAMDVSEAKEGDTVQPGKVLIAPGDRHMMLTRGKDYYRVTIKDAPKVNRFRPSVDVLFNSVAKVVGKNAVGVIMTGMGNDGAQGLLNMKQAGAKTIAQDEQTSVVFGMPKEAIAKGAADHILPLQKISGKFCQLASTQPEKVS